MKMRDDVLTSIENKLDKQRPWAIRRCLGGCDCWMRSTGPGHRICNECKEGTEHGVAWIPLWRGGQRIIITKEDVACVR